MTERRGPAQARLNTAPSNSVMVDGIQRSRRVSEVEYVRQYFTENARAWLSSAYRSEQVPRAYPVGAERVAIALDIVGRSVD